MLLIGPKNDVISKKKGLLGNFNSFSRQNQVISKKKGFLRNFNGFSGQNQVISQKKKVFSEISSLYPAEIKLFACDFDGPFTSQCHLDGPPLELMGPLKFMGPEVIVPPCPPSRRPCSSSRQSMYYRYTNLLFL